MPRIKLTDRSVAAAVAPEGQRLELQDVSENGLSLRVTSRGHKSWIYRYRSPRGPQRLTLGSYPAVGLSDARMKVRMHVRTVQDGGDPVWEKRSERERVAAEPIKTFDDLADAYLKACEKGLYKPRRKVKRARSIEDERGILRRYVRPVLGPLPPEAITRREVKALLLGLYERGITTQTNRAHACIRGIFNYAISIERVEVNPATGFAPIAEEKPRVRVWTDKELKALWGVLSDTVAVREIGLSRQVAIALQLAAVTLQREGEIAGMRLSELNLDQGLWLLPEERTKGRRPHLVPLPPRALELIKQALEVAALIGPSEFVFPAPLGGGLKALRATELSHGMAVARERIKVAGATVHDLRRTGSTALTSERIGVSPFIRSKVLGHSSDTGGGAAVSVVHYDANDYVAEKRRALGAWTDLLMAIVGENVVELRAANA